jgi:hypothetical protein
VAGQQSAKWAEPRQHVVHHAEIHDLDQVAIAVLDEEKPLAAVR